MTKRPVIKKRRPKKNGRDQYSAYQRKQLTKLINKRNSPYAVKAEPKNIEKKAITKIKA